MKYAIVVRPLPEEKGGGYIGLVPDLQGCMSDGDTPEEAFANALDAANEWLDLHRRVGRPIPEPGSAVKRAKEEREALLRVINMLSSDLNGRLDNLEAKFEELRAVLAKIQELTSPVPAYIVDMMQPDRQKIELCH